MKKEKIIILIMSLLLMGVPFFINIYSIYKLISVAIGIILMDIVFVLKKKPNIFLLIYLPIVLIIFTYSIDYLKTYTLKLVPIFAFENKINDDISIYNSLMYRVYKCNNKLTFDNNYKKSYMCDTLVIDEISINKLLNEPLESYKEYKNNFIKVTGKISRISGSSSIELQAYTEVEGEFNGYVKFNETSKLIVNLKDIDVSKYKIYDYITIVGLLSRYDRDSETLTLTDTKLEEKELYNEYNLHVIEKTNCTNTLNTYIDNYYLFCLENIILDYGIDKYELSYALKDKKITIDEFLENTTNTEKEDYVVYEHDKFNILSCSKEKNIIINKNKKIDYSLCKE